MECVESLYDEVQRSCSVCYQTFSEVEDTVPRIQHCGHVACTVCLEECFEEANVRRKEGEEKGCGVRCPECFVLHAVGSVSLLPVYSEGLVANRENPPVIIRRRSSQLMDLRSIDEEGSPPSLDSSASSETDNSKKKTHGHRHYRELDGSEQMDNTNKLAMFLSITKNPIANPMNEIIDDCTDDDSDIRICSVEGCDQRDTYRTGFCMNHTKRASVISVNAMVNKMKNTGLKHVSLKSDKVAVRARIRGRFEPDDIAMRFKRQERMDLGEAVELIEAAREVLKDEKNVVELNAPVMVVGDLHGQYFDFLNILRMWRPDHNILFLGDYVDRGAFSCEVILHLLALKLKYPRKVFLLRGNHECSTVSAHFGFKEECKVKYGLTVYYQFLLCFQSMPISAIICSKIGRIFCAHGGISPQISTVEDINKIDRFAEPDMDGPLCDILWSDPMNEDEVYKLTDDEYREFLQMDYIKNQVRGCSFMFGYKAAARFLRENKLIYMLRAHEVQEDGFRSHFANPGILGLGSNCHRIGSLGTEMTDSTDNDSEDDNEAKAAEHAKAIKSKQNHLYPTVLTVFSAPNYCDRYGNKAAVLHVESMGYYTVNLLEAEPHPVPTVQEDVSLMQLLAMGKTCPYMPTNFREFLRIASEMGPALNPVETTNGHNIPSAPSEMGPLASPKIRRSSVSHRFTPSPGIWKEVRSSIEATLERVRPVDDEENPETPSERYEGVKVEGIIKQNSWFDVAEALSPSSQRQREHYRMAHARDGINEMHPDVMAKRISHSENIEGVLDPRGAITLSNASEGDSNTSPTGVKRRQFSLDLNSETETEQCTGDRLAHRIRSSSVTNLVGSDDKKNFQPYISGIDSSESSLAPSQILFSHEEIIVLKLIFSLFDRKGKEFISRDDIIAYAEEGGDYAQLKEVDACMEAIDADNDGRVGLHDYINFAARLKNIYELQVASENAEIETYMAIGMHELKQEDSVADGEEF